MKILVLTTTILNSVAFFPRDTKAAQRVEPFFPPTGRSKPFFAPNTAAHIQSTKNENASVDDSTIAISNANNLLRTYTTTREEEAEPAIISFIGTTTLMRESSTKKTDATAILENYTALLDVPDLENQNTINATYRERYGKTASNITDLSQKDNSIVINATNRKNDHRTTVNTQIPSISSAKNDFESIPIWSTYKTDTKSIMIATDIDEATSNINPINTISNINRINPVLNYRMYKENSNLIGNSDDTKTMLDVGKNMHVGDLITFNTNGISSIKDRANPNPIEPLPDTNINFKITSPSKDNPTIKGRHTVRIENIKMPNNNYIAKATRSKVDDLITKRHSNIPANAYVKTDRNNFKSVNTDKIEFVIPWVQKITNMDQDDEVGGEVIFIHPDTSMKEIGRKVYSLYPDVDYAQTARNKIILSDISDMFNPFFKYKVKLISLSINNDHAYGGAGPNPKTDFPMHKVYTLLSAAEPPALMPNAQNNQAQKPLLIKDPLSGAWISDSVTENPHVINDTIIQKQKINKGSEDTLNHPLESTFLTANFTSPSDVYNVTASASKQTTNTTNSSDLVIDKATMPEGRHTVTTASLSARTAGIHTPRKGFGSLMDKKMSGEEESTPYVEVKSSVGDDAVFQVKEDLLPAHNFKYFESGDSGFERNGFVAVDTTKSLSQLNSIIPIAEVTISERDLTNSGEDFFDILYDFTNPENGKTHFKTMATDSLSNSVAVKENMAAESTEFLPPHNSIFQTGRVDHHILPNAYYNVIIDNPPTITKENQNLAQSIMKHKLSLPTLGNAHLINYRDGHQTPFAVTSSNNKRLTSDDKMDGAEIANTPLGISYTPVANDIYYADQNTEVITDLALTASTSPVKKGLLTMNKVSTFSYKPNKPGDDFTISKDLDVSRDNGTVLIVDPSIFTKSIAPSQATSPVKKTSLADIIIPKTFYIKSTPVTLTVPVTTAPQGYIDTMFYIPQYESENTFKEDITLNYEADPPNNIDIMAEEEDILTEENVRDHIYVTPIAGDNVPEGNNLAAKHCSLNSDVYNSIGFKGTTKSIAGQLDFEDPASSYMTEISKSPFEKSIPEFQEKVVVRNSNSGAEHVAFFGDIYPKMKENVPKGYTFPPKRRHNFKIPMKDNIKSALETTMLLDKGTSSKKYSSYIDEQTHPGTEKDQVATGSITNSHMIIIPVTFSTPVFSEDINVGNYYSAPETSPPLSLRYANTLRDDFFILRPVATLAKENNLDGMDLITIEPDKSDSEYISNKHTFELEKEENNSIKKPVQSTHGPNRFLSYIPSPKGETSKSLLYRLTQPEFKTKEKYQTIILKEENSDSDIFATSFKDYTKNFNTRHLKTLVPSLIDEDEMLSPEFQEKTSAGKSTLSEDDVIIILPEVSDLGNKKSNYFPVPHTETIIMEESRTSNDVPTDYGVMASPIKSQGHFYRKGISSNVYNTAPVGLADSITSEDSKVNENKMGFSEVMPSDDHINPLPQDIASQVKNIPYVSEITKGVIKTTSVASLNPVKANKMRTNATTISHSVSALDSKESNENGESIMPAVDGILSNKLNSLLIPNQKIPRTAVVFSKIDGSLSDKLVSLQESEPLGEDSVIIDQNRGVTKEHSDPQFFSMISSVPLDVTTLLENSTNVVTGMPTTENVGINNKSDIMAFVPNISLQPIIYKNEQINNTSDHVVNKAVTNPSAKEVTTSETEANAFLKKNTGVVEDESHTSEAKIPVNLRDINSMDINLFTLKPDVAYVEQKAPGTLKQIFYPDSTVSTTKPTKARTMSSFSLDNDNLKRSTTNSYNNNLYHLPLKPTPPPTDFVADFIKITHSELNPALNMRESNKKLTDESIISNSIILLPDKEIISPNNIIFLDDIRNIANEKRYVDSTEKDKVTQYEDFSVDSDVVFPARENNPNNINLSTAGLDSSTVKYVTEESTFNVEEEGKSPTTEVPAFIQGLHRFESPFSTAHVTGSLLNENPVGFKTKQKYQILISRKETPYSYEDDPFLKDYTAKFMNKSPGTRTHSLTYENKKMSPRFPSDLALEGGTLYGNDIITIFPESKWIEQINAPELDSKETVGESRSFPDEITDLTLSETPIISKDQLNRRYVTFTFLYDQRKPTISLKSEHNQDKTLKAENYHLQDVTTPLVTFNVNLDNEFHFVEEDSETTKNKPLTSSAMKTAPTMAGTPVLPIQNNYEVSNSMQPDKNNVRSREFQFPLTTENDILMPEVLTEDSILKSNNPLTDSSKSVLGVLETVTEYLDLIDGTDISGNQGIQIQTDLQPHSLDSIISPIDSTTFTSSSTDDEADSTPTMERDTANSKVKTDAQPLSTIMKILSSRQRRPFPSEIKKIAKLSAEEEPPAKFNSGPIINSTALVPTLEKTLVSTPDSSALSKSNNSKGEEHSISGAGNFALGDSRMLKDDSFIDKFNISTKIQAPPNLKIIHSADSSMTLGKTIKLKDENSTSFDEDTGTAGLLHNAPTGIYELLWKLSISPNFTTSLSSSKYSELDPVVKMKKNTTTKTNNSVPFQERYIPSPKHITSPSNNSLTKDMLNTILKRRFVHRYFVGKDIIPEYEVLSITENISDISLDSENIPNDDYIISTALDNRGLEYVANEYVFEQQEEKNNSITKTPTLSYDPKIVGSCPLYSSADTSEYAFQDAPVENKIKEILRTLISRKELANSELDAIVPKSSTDNLNSKSFKSIIYPLTHSSDNFYNIFHETTLKEDSLREDDTIIILPEDKRMEYILVPDSEIIVTMVKEKMFPNEPTDPTVITSPLKNKNQFYRKVTSSIFNINAQDEAENILLSKVDNVKDRNHMAETQHSWDSIIPLADLSAIPDGKFPFINENTENNNKSRGFLALPIPEKPMFIPNALSTNLEISDPAAKNFLANSSVLWPNMFKSIIEYPSSINGGDNPIKNKTDLKHYSLTSTKLPTGSITFSDDLTNSEFDSLPLVNRETPDFSKTDTGEIYSEFQRTVMKAFFPTKVSQHRVYEERKNANFSDQDLDTKFDLSHIIDATILSSVTEKILPSVTKPSTLSKSDTNVEEVHISKAGNFFPKDASSLKDNSFTVEFGATLTEPQAPLNIEEIFSGESTLSLPKASRYNDQSSSLEVTRGEGIIANTPTGTYGLPPWKSTLLPSDFAVFRHSSKYFELDPVTKVKKDTTTKTDNIIPTEERNTLPDKVTILPTIIISTEDMKNPIDTINNNKFGYNTFIKEDIPTEEVPFIENISEEAYNTLLAGENISNNEDIITIMPIDNALDDVEDNSVFELIKEENVPLIRKITLTDSNVFESHAPYASVATLEHLLQGSPIDIQTTKNHRSLIPKEGNHNSDTDATLLKRSTINFSIKAPRSEIYPLTDSSWMFLPEFLDEADIENSFLTGDNIVTTIPKGKRLNYPFIRDPELITRMGKGSIFTTDPTDPAVMISPIEYEDQFNRRDISPAFYNSAVPDEAKITLSARFDAMKHKPSVANMLHSQNIIPLAEFNVIPDDLLFINQNTEENNIASIFSSLMNKAASTMGDSIVLSTEGSYEGGDSMLPGEDNVKSRQFLSLLTSAMPIPNSLTENPETLGLMTDNFLSESLITMPEVLERATEYGDVPERQIITQADIHFYPSTWNIPPTGLTFSEGITDGEVDSFFFMSRDIPDNYKTKTDKMHSKSQRRIIKAFSPREDSQNNIYKTRKITNIFNQDPAAKLELSHFTNASVSIPAIEKILSSATEFSPLSKDDNNMNDYFTRKFGATSFKPQTPPNLAEIFLADSTLTLPKTSRPASPDEVTNTEGSITSTPTGLYGRQWRSIFPPPDFTQSMGTSKYSELVPVTIMGKDTTKEIDYNISPEEIIILSDEVSLSPIIISPDKGMASTFKGNIHKHKDLRERKRADEYDEIIYFTEGTSESAGDNSAGKIIPVYVDPIIVMSDDSGSEQVSDKYGFELENRANNSL
ncbi:uncharacterized protein LOC118499675 isoform X2 [Phyllostomus discolor]|uniref:Uncharacterized protein LOC118499675 isoform X2 n=1 Tax=Phyllostomus discolor TaxID=89673 RepID=A0A7E6DEX6_9CHIR|nr:uncharacterized protein LOC118499675 isoform X2 [Phyllostomus discolor]